MRTVVIWCIALAPFAHGQKLSDAEATALLERARKAALEYTASLPDFICTETVRRYEDPRGDNRWLPLDTLTVKLSFFNREEDYKLVAINGKPTLLDFTNTGGSITKGEFGSMLLFLFHPKIEAKFRWKGWGTVHKTRSAVYSYKVDQPHTQFRVSYGVDVEGPNSILAPYHGEVFVEPESGQVLRASQEAELPVGFPIKRSSNYVEYDYAEVSRKRYLLPRTAEASMSAARLKTRNIVEFREFRKFQAETTITFDK